MTRPSGRTAFETAPPPLLWWFGFTLALAPIVLDAQALPAMPTPEPVAVQSLWHDLAQASARLPLAGVLGAALALRPKRRGTPD